MEGIEMHGRRHLIALALAVGTSITLASTALAGETAPPVRVVTIAELNQPVGFTFAPSGRIVYLERATGELRLLDPRWGRDRLWHTITGVNADGERGALGVALHPGWPRKATVGPVMHTALDAGRWSLAAPPATVPLTNYDGPVYSMEVAPDGRIYFSDGQGIYRLAST